jgi:hypothetical protein
MAGGESNCTHILQLVDPQFSFVKVIAQQADPLKPADPENRNNFASTVRLLQMDFAIATPHTHSPTGWVFGTYIYDGRCVVSY